MEKWRATHRLLLRTSNTLLIHRCSNPNFQNSIPSSGSIHGGEFGISGFIRNYGRTCEPFNSCIDHQNWEPKTCKIGNRVFSSLATKIERDRSFATLNSEDISYFKLILGEKNVVQDEEVLLTANTDWMRKFKGSSKLMLLPRSAHEVCFSLFSNIPILLDCL